MLQLDRISKVYSPGSNQVKALRGISLSFRKSDFVSILGPSGCGKTTLLNIIGGLDHATDGELIINGRSTKKYRDRDWDAYRNHSIGFVFQNYHLIPHQSVLQNVELALTLAGVSKSERRRRAKQALADVGLSDQLKKKPGEMSGGQMQRVAIARALINDPDIILADEPTGALDTETSVQVMEILKKISEKKLVIMVTHNPELAEKYSTRIIRMLDGNVLSDSSPLSDEEIAHEQAEDQKELQNKKKIKLPSMSFATAFGLSLKNLFTKKGRTVLTSFAGSIGIIGIALIFAVSQGTTNYINLLQEDTLASYPLTLQETTVNFGTLIETFIGKTSENYANREEDKVYSQAVLYDMMNAMNSAETTENDLKSFKAYLDKERAKPAEESELSKAITGVKYTYDLDLLVYTENVDGKIIKSDSEDMLAKAMKDNLGMDMEGMMSLAETYTSSEMMSMMGGGVQLWVEMLSAEDGGLISPVLENQYDVVYGRWPSAYNEIVLVLNEYNEIDDLTLYALGLKSEKEINDIFMSVMRQEEIKFEQDIFEYEELADTVFKVIPNSECFYFDENTGSYMDLRENETSLRYLYGNAIPLKITGVIRPSENATSAMLNASGTSCIGYTKALTEYIIERAGESKAIEKQLASPETDIFTGLPFRGEDTGLDKASDFRKYVAELSEAEKAEAYITIKSQPTEEQLVGAVEAAMKGMDRATMVAQMIGGMSDEMGMSKEMAMNYISAMSDEDIRSIFIQAVREQAASQIAEGVKAQLSQVPAAQLAVMLEGEMAGYTDEQMAEYYECVVLFSDSDLESNLKMLGYVDIDSPASINLYAATFESKEVIEQAITDYNAGVDELSQIRYTDYVGIMMSSVTSIINAVTYVLVAFVAISLVVSSIMIGVITLISVQERTREIGILRAVGASKRNVSSMFNAETMIIGFTSGALGILVTYLLCIPINAIIHALTEIYTLSAYLPPEVAAALVVISVLLTLISGIIPSRSAAKKDPVEALRTE